MGDRKKLSGIRIFSLSSIMLLAVLNISAFGAEAKLLDTFILYQEKIISEPVCAEGPAIASGYVTDGTAGTGLANVQVSIGGCMTTTDDQGYYSLTNIATGIRAVISFSHDGYYKNSTIIQIDQYNEGTTVLSSNYVEFSLQKYASWNPWSFDSAAGASGGAVEIPASACINPNGTKYQGIVKANWIFVDTMTTEGRDAFPGQYEGKTTKGEIVPFVSYGFMSLELEDQSGNALDVTGNMNFILNSVSGTTAASIPLWYFDYEQGIWIEEGSAIKQSDGSYKATVARPGTWSISQPISESPGIYRGHIVYESDGKPAKDVRVHAVGANWIRTDLSTNAEGNFEIEVIPGSSFQLKAYNYKDKYEAVYDDTIPAIASGEIVEETE